jgi:hypothetical protein
MLAYEFHQPGFLRGRRVRCSLGESELTIEWEGKPPVRIAYQALTAVRLSSRAHGRNEAAMRVRDFRCQVSAPGQVVEITNRSDPGVGRAFRYANHAFGGFVRELHHRLGPFQARIRFRSGDDRSFRLAVGAGMLVAVLGPFRLASYPDLAFGVAIYLSALAGLFLAARRLRPRGYSPTNLPDHLLPAGEDERGFLA